MGHVPCGRNTDRQTGRANRLQEGTTFHTPPLHMCFPCVTLTKFIVTALPKADIRRIQLVNVRHVLTLSRIFSLSHSPRRCSCGLRGRAIRLFLSTAWQKRRSTSSDLCGLHEFPAHRSQCHRAVRGILLWTTSFRDRCEATFQILFRAPELDRIYSFSRREKEGQTGYPQHLPLPSNPQSTKIFRTIAWWYST